VPPILICCTVLAAAPLPARAGSPAAATETVIRLTVSPAAAPKPALRYLLLPELREMNPGNPIPNYLKGLLDQDYSADQETLGRAALRQADRAARLDKPDWQILPKIKTDGISLLIPDVQKMRTLAAGLQARFRDEVARDQLDDALVTAKTLFAMSRLMGEHPTLIGDLVGIAIAFTAIGPLEEMLERPGCPNLYWALTNLPSPLVPLDRGMEGERVLIASELRALDDTTPMSPDRLKKFIAYIDRIREIERKPDAKDRTTRAWLDARIRDEGVVRAARGRLVAAGLREEQVQKFPADQVILLDEKREYEVRRDEEMKLMNLPTWEVEVAARAGKVVREPALFDLFLPSLLKVRRAQGRVEQRVALLRHVEAVRLYAAGHGGRPPSRLSEAGVPLPPDPFTGLPFRYSADGATAHLRGSPPPGEEQNPVYNVRYEITIRK